MRSGSSSRGCRRNRNQYSCHHCQLDHERIGVALEIIYSRTIHECGRVHQADGITVSLKVTMVSQAVFVCSFCKPRLFQQNNCHRLQSGKHEQRQSSHSAVPPKFSSSPVRCWDFHLPRSSSQISGELWQIKLRWIDSGIAVPSCWFFNYAVLNYPSRPWALQLFNRGLESGLKGSQQGHMECISPVTLLSTNILHPARQEIYDDICICICIV